MLTHDENGIGCALRQEQHVFPGTLMDQARIMKATYVTFNVTLFLFLRVQVYLRSGAQTMHTQLPKPDNH